MGGKGRGGIQYIGSGIFYPWGVSISAATAGLDITSCNSAGGIIDLSTGSRHQHHHRKGGDGRAATRLRFCRLIHPVSPSEG